ncbi:MAG: RluA family pseudouridine synthase [Candidatus Omnitrophica bacterium]|nr:RluA family pseudouridine synthase [Candidatus Omnitrophota bacterium]
MNIPYTIVFEDEHLIVLNKIAKLLVQPSPKKEKYTLTSLLNDELGEKKQKALPCHRLDRETTGLIIYAKSAHIQSLISNQFRERSVEKKYIAFVQGRLKRPKGILKGSIIDSEGKRYREKAKPAHSGYRVRRQYRNFCVLELIPLTGRTNQLRIQLKGIGHPILGERKYAYGRDFPVKFRRLALHAFYLRFYHPVTHKFLRFEIDLPEDMAKFLEKYNKVTTYREKRI